jgi:hypothetical protein
MISIVSAPLEVFPGYVLCYAGLSGDDFMESAKRVKRLISQNGTTTLGDSTHFGFLHEKSTMTNYSLQISS